MMSPYVNAREYHYCDMFYVSDCVSLIYIKTTSSYLVPSINQLAAVLAP